VLFNYPFGMNHYLTHNEYYFYNEHFGLRQNSAWYKCDVSKHDLVTPHFSRTYQKLNLKLLKVQFTQ